MNSKKKSILEALKASMGNVSAACEVVGISRKTFYQWKKEDEEFRTRSDEMNEVVLDIVEDALLTQIKNGNSTSTIFYLKTKGKHRGYIEKQQIENTSKLDVNLKELVRFEDIKPDLSCLTLDELITLDKLQEKVAKHNKGLYDPISRQIEFIDNHDDYEDS